MHCFQLSWYKEFPFVEYSKSADAVYCYCCQHFPSLSGNYKDVFVTGFNGWHRAMEKLIKHSNSHNHIRSFESWTNYKLTKATGTVADAIHSQSSAEIQENRRYLTS